MTDDLRDRLLANGHDRDVDHVPVVKFFNPLGEGVWRATELDADATLFPAALQRTGHQPVFGLDRIVLAPGPLGSTKKCGASDSLRSAARGRLIFAEQAEAGSCHQYPPRCRPQYQFSSSKSVCLA